MKKTNLLIEQWGNISITTETTKTIIFPISFKGTSYNLIIQSYGNTETSNNQYWNSQEITNKTTLDFRFKFAQGRAIAYDWRVIGL